jgi:AraC-like DNA-binding protein
VEVDDPQASYYYPPDATEPWHFLAFTFHGLQAHVMVRALLRQYGPIYQLPRESRIIQRLLAYENPPQPPGHTSVSQIELYEGVELVTELLMALMASRQGAERNDHSQDLIQQVIAMITADVTASLRVSDVAQQLGVSREHLSRLCHSRLGKPLRTLMLEQRMYRARRLLKETDLPIKTIAGMLGYTAYPNFLSAFKDVMKQTPYEFRVNGTLTDFMGYIPAQRGGAAPG